MSHEVRSLLEWYREQRRRIRLEVRGEVSGLILEEDLALTLRNLSSGGFLAETTDRIPIGSTHTVKLIARDGLVVTATVRCAHCRELRPSAIPAYAIGFAFVGASEHALDLLLDRLTASLTFD